MHSAVTTATGTRSYHAVRCTCRYFLSQCHQKVRASELQSALSLPDDLRVPLVDSPLPLTPAVTYTEAGCC